MINYYSKNIQNIILLELLRAQSSIKIAVAWFTNNILFETLLTKLQAGIKVELILNDDEINHADSSLNYNRFVNQGGILKWNNKQSLLHVKLCIIDDSIVITGSYNWTNKAECTNEENICVIKNEEAVLTDSLNQFDSISSKLIAQERRLETESSLPEFFFDEHSGWYSRNPLVLLNTQYLNDTEYHVLEGTIAIADDAFASNKYVRKITMPDSVKSIGVRAFKNCESLEEITLSNSIELLPEYCFEHCGKLKIIHFSSSLKIIEHGVFDSCESLRVENFSSLPFLDSISDDCWYHCDVGHYKEQPSRKFLFFSKQNVEVFSFVEGTTRIRQLGICPNAKELHLPKSIKYIDAYAFRGFSSLKEVHIPSSCQLIGEGAFYGSGLTKVFIPKSVEYIESYAFKGCKSLREIEFEIGSKCHYVAKHSFQDCLNLNSVIWPSFSYPFSVGKSAFEGCTNIVEIQFPEKMDTISEKAFYGCTKLSKIIFPYELRTIGHGAFVGCTDLLEFSLPYNVNVSRVAFDPEFGNVYCDTLGSPPIVPLSDYLLAITGNQTNINSKKTTKSTQSPVVSHKTSPNKNIKRQRTQMSHNFKFARIQMDRRFLDVEAKEISRIIFSKYNALYRAYIRQYGCNNTASYIEDINDVFLFIRAERLRTINKIEVQKAIQYAHNNNIGWELKNHNGSFYFEFDKRYETDEVLLNISEQIKYK